MSSIYVWSRTADQNGSIDELIDFKEGQKPRTYNNSFRAFMRRVREYLYDTGGSCDGLLVLGKGAEAGTVIHIQTSSSIDDYCDELVIRFRAVGTIIRGMNAGITTISVNKLPAKPCFIATKDGIQSLSGGEIFLGSIYTIVYRASGDNIGWHLLNPTRHLLEESLHHAKIPSGMIMNFGSKKIPDGWLACDGKEYSRWDYPHLFARIGIAWGEGDGSTTFNVPDLRGMFIRGCNDDHPFATYESDIIKSHAIEGTASEYEPDRERDIVDIPSAPPISPIKPSPVEPIITPIESPYDPPSGDRNKLYRDCIFWAIGDHENIADADTHGEAVQRLKDVLSGYEYDDKVINNLVNWAIRHGKGLMSSFLVGDDPHVSVYRNAKMELQNILVPLFVIKKKEWHDRTTKKYSSPAILTPSQKLDRFMLRGLYGWDIGRSEYDGISTYPSSYDLTRVRHRRDLSSVLPFALLAGAGFLLYNILTGKDTSEPPHRIGDIDVDYTRIGYDAAEYPIYKLPYAHIFFDQEGYLVNPNTCSRTSRNSYPEHLEAAKRDTWSKLGQGKSISKMADPIYPYMCGDGIGYCASRVRRDTDDIGEDEVILDEDIRRQGESSGSSNKPVGAIRLHVDMEKWENEKKWEMNWYDLFGFRVDPNTCLRSHVEEDSKISSEERITRAAEGGMQDLNRYVEAVKFYNMLGEDFPIYKFGDRPTESEIPPQIREEYLRQLMTLLQHKHEFESDRIGGIETRPVNVSVNFAIKV